MYENNLAFSVTIDEIQDEAKHRIGRELNDDELRTTIKGIESGLSFDIGTVFQAAISEAVEINKS